MSYYNIAKQLTGRISNTPLALAKDTVREALVKIYQDRDWSFERAITYANWLVPGNVVNTGTFTVSTYSNQVVASAAATAAIIAWVNAPVGKPLITTLQFRNPAYSIYNIIGYDDGTSPDSPNPGFVTLTLDRPWLEPVNGSTAYMIYQCYFVAPEKLFKKFVEARDTRNAWPLDFTSMTQSVLAQRDPQRLRYADPSYIVPAGVDRRPNTSTPGWQMFELWPQQLSYRSYSFSYRAMAPIPESYEDFMTMEPPYPLNEELVRHRAEELLYQYREAQKDQSAARGSGSNWIILSQMAQKEYQEQLDKVTAIDLNLNGEELHYTRQGPGAAYSGPYSNYAGQLNIGGFPGRYRW